jgi:hypothetical protein
VSKNESDLAYPFKLDSACELAENNQQRDGLSSFRQPTPESGLVDGLDFVELETHSQRGLGIYDRGGRAEGSIAMSDAYLHRRPLGQRINHIHVAAALAKVTCARGEPHFGVNFHNFGGGDERDARGAT